MCGRSSLTKTEKEIEARFRSTFYSDELERYNPLPNYNVAPTNWCPVITNEEPSIIHLFKWGLIPFWSKDEKSGYKMINARKESLLDKKTFSKLVESKRCIVPMDGFYEWKKAGKEKHPFRIIATDQEIFAVAGLWETWKNHQNEIIHSFTIITIEANEIMEKIHDRMPAILLKENESLWLDNSIKVDDLMSLLLPYPSEKMHAYRVSDKVGNVRENNADLIKPYVPVVQGDLFNLS